MHGKVSYDALTGVKGFMKFSELTSGVKGCQIRGDANVDVNDIAYNTSKIGDRSCFIALRGSRVDGHDYISDAMSRGAVAVVSEEAIESIGGVVNGVVDNSRRAMAEMACKLYGNPSSSMKLFGVTGTNGKTTVTYILEAILEEAGLKPGVIGTISYKYGDREIRASHTTPESVDLQKLLAEMVKSGVASCVMEVSSHALSQERATGCAFDCAIFTNLTPEHLDYHDGMSDYFESKALLFESLLPMGGKRSFAVINSDDEYGVRLINRSRVSTIKYGFGESADVRGSALKVGADGLSMKVVVGGVELEVESSLCGTFNAMNILAGIAAADGMGIDSSIISRAIKKLGAVPGRFERVENGRGVIALVDYAHTADALENVLSHARELINGSGGRLITIFGCGGDRDHGKRAIMGAVVGKLSDVAIVTSDNPRSEKPDDIIAEILPGVNKFSKEFDGRIGFEVIGNRRDAIARAVEMSTPGDIILLAGKGHEDYQIIGNEKKYFDDREMLKKFLNA